MNRLLQIIVIFAFSISFCKITVAQKTGVSVSIEEKKNTNTTDSGIGFKVLVLENPAIPSQSQQQKSTNSNAIELPIVLNENISRTDNSVQKTEGFVTANIDFDKMPFDVQQKINSNKISGKNLLTGIIRGYKIEIKTVKEINDLQNITNIVSSVKGFIKCEFVSSGIINLIVEPTIDTENFETALINAGIKSNFLSEFYLVDNIK